MRDRRACRTQAYGAQKAKRDPSGREDAAVCIRVYSATGCLGVRGRTRRKAVVRCGAYVARGQASRNRHSSAQALSTAARPEMRESRESASSCVFPVCWPSARASPSLAPRQLKQGVMHNAINLHSQNSIRRTLSDFCESCVPRHRWRRGPRALDTRVVSSRHVRHPNPP